MSQIGDPFSWSDPWAVYIYVYTTPTNTVGLQIFVTNCNKLTCCTTCKPKSVAVYSVGPGARLEGRPATFKLSHPLINAKRHSVRRGVHSSGNSGHVWFCCRGAVAKCQNQGGRPGHRMFFHHRNCDRLWQKQTLGVKIQNLGFVIAGFSEE